MVELVSINLICKLNLKWIDTNLKDINMYKNENLVFGNYYLGHHKFRKCFSFAKYFGEKTAAQLYIKLDFLLL